MTLYISAPTARSSGESIDSKGKIKATYTEKRLIRYGAGDAGPFGGPLGYRAAADAAALAFPYLSVSAVDAFLRLKARPIEQGDARGLGTYYTLTLTYDNDPLESPEEEENPLARPPKISSRAQMRTVACDVDRHGDPILTSVGLPPTTLPEKDVADRVFSVEKETATWDESVADQFAGVLNSAPFLGKPARTVLCADLGAASAFENGVSHWVRTMEFVYRRSGWDFQRLDADVYENASSEAGGVRLRIKDAGGDPIGDPVPLDGAGGVVEAADLPDDAFFHTDELLDEDDLNDLLT